MPAWKKEYEIGHLMLDIEQKHLFDIANEAFEVVEPSQKKAKIISVLNKLMNYLNIHSEHEEDYLKSINCPLLSEQKNMHKKISDHFHHWKKSFASKSLSVIEKELAHGIESFIITHIKHDDVKIRIWCQEHNIDMNNILWQESYSLGNELIDNEHKHLFEIANEAFTHVPLKQKKEKIRHTIHELYAYMKEHFEHEETLMKSIHYKDYEQHAVIHKNIENEMNTFIQNISEMSISELEDQLALFIEHWLILHVIHEDNKIAIWLSQNNKTFNLPDTKEHDIIPVVDITEKGSDPTPKNRLKKEKISVQKK